MTASLPGLAWPGLACLACLACLAWLCWLAGWLAVSGCCSNSRKGTPTCLDSSSKVSSMLSTTLYFSTGRSSLSRAARTANLRTKILDFRGFDSNLNLNFKGWKSYVHREFPGKFEPTKLNRESLSREIARRSIVRGPLQLAGAILEELQRLRP